MQQRRPGVVLLDLMRPVTDAWDFVSGSSPRRRFQTSPRLPHGRVRSGSGIGGSASSLPAQAGGHGCSTRPGGGFVHGPELTRPPTEKGGWDGDHGRADRALEF